MANVFALLIGIDEYQADIDWSLQGCVKDVEDVERFLDDSVGTRSGSRADVKMLCNGKATRDAVIDGFRRHLGQAGLGDAALFWFSGHGSSCEVPRHYWHLEEDGTSMQTLLCADSRVDGVPDLLDKELAILIGEVAARGPHVTVVLDCCHAGGGSRTPPSVRARWVPPASQPPDPARLLRGHGRTAVGSPSPRGRGADHVALAACQRDQKANEKPHEDHVRGVFSLGLLTELRRPRPAPSTYRELMAATRGYVENLFELQSPELYPQADSIVDQPFLGGHVRAPATTMTMHDHQGSWVLDAGSCHGLAAGSGVDGIRVAVLDSRPIQESRVVRVFADHSVVEPLDWFPAPGETYPVVVSHVLIPETTVSLGGGDGDDDSIARRIESAIGIAGPNLRPSPHLRLVRRNDPDQLADLTVATPPGKLPTIRSADGVALADGSAEPDPSGHLPIVVRLEHIARWRTIRGLANPLSRLAGLVQVELLVPRPGEHRTPDRRVGLRPGATGVVELEYKLDQYGWRPPSIFIRIDNKSDRRLYCVLLDLTDRFRIHASLFPGSFIEPGASAAAAEGGLIALKLPHDRAVVPGAQVRDWLMLIVSEDRINSDHFALPGITERGLTEPSARRLREQPAAMVGVVERLALSARYRDAERASPVARDWWTSVIEVVTRVPGDTGAPEDGRAGR
jgi:Caspase domain